MGPLFGHLGLELARDQLISVSFRLTGPQWMNIPNRAFAPLLERFRFRFLGLLGIGRCQGRKCQQQDELKRQQSTIAFHACLPLSVRCHHRANACGLPAGCLRSKLPMPAFPLLSFFRVPGGGEAAAGNAEKRSFAGGSHVA